MAAAVAGLASAAAAGLYGWEWRQDEDIALVVASAMVDPAKCADARLPVWFEVFNGSTKTITYTSFYLRAKRPGRSTDVVDFHRNAEYLIPPQTRLFACAAPKMKADAQGEDLQALEWTMGLTEVRFAD